MSLPSSKERPELILVQRNLTSAACALTELWLHSGPDRRSGGLDPDWRDRHLRNGIDGERHSLRGNSAPVVDLRGRSDRPTCDTRALPRLADGPGAGLGGPQRCRPALVHADRLFANDRGDGRYRVPGDERNRALARVQLPRQRRRPGRRSALGAPRRRSRRPRTGPGDYSEDRGRRCHPRRPDLRPREDRHDRRDGEARGSTRQPVLRRIRTTVTAGLLLPLAFQCGGACRAARRQRLGSRCGDDLVRGLRIAHADDRVRNLVRQTSHMWRPGAALQCHRIDATADQPDPGHRLDRPLGHRLRRLVVPERLGSTAHRVRLLCRGRDLSAVSTRIARRHCAACDLRSRGGGGLRELDLGRRRDVCRCGGIERDLADRDLASARADRLHAALYGGGGLARSCSRRRFCSTSIV